MTVKIVSNRSDYSSNSKLVQGFLANYSSENTKISYTSMLNRYFNFLKIEPDSYFGDSRDFSKDVKSYAIEINSLAPKTQKARLACIKMFLSENDIELKQKVWRNINRRRNGNHAITQDKTPTPSELKQILQFGIIKGRALFLVLSSGGMRVEEALNITWNNIDFEKDPVIIRIPAFTKDKKKITKNGRSRITFITSEAKEAILEWKKVRDDYLKKAVEKTTVAVKKYYKDARLPIDNERIFPFHYSTAIQCWENVLC
jgi:integrase